MEQRDQQELVVCYDVGTGEPVWHHSITARHETIPGGVGPRSTPTIHEGRVYALGATGILRCLEGGPGAEIWTVDLLRESGTNQQQDELLVAWGRASSPLIVADKVIVPAGGPPDKLVSLVALDKLTGKRIWEGGANQVSYASPMIATIGGRADRVGE
jgi:outer membrane protein assembly factor BamB